MDDDMPTNRQPVSKKEWDAALYDNQHSYVWKYGAAVIELLSPQPGERILDLGCGTGHLTAKIAACGANVIGIDRAPAMIEQAKRAYPDVYFEIADATDFQFAEPFDAVFSNAVLHWIRQPVEVIACIWRALKPGGRLVAEFGGKGNVEKLIAGIYAALEAVRYPRRAHPWYFPSIGQYAVLLEKQGFSVTYAALFDRLTALGDGETGLRNWMDMFADDFLAGILPEKRDEVIRHMERQLRSELYRNGSWLADYKRIRVVASKPLRSDQSGGTEQPRPPGGE